MMLSNCCCKEDYYLRGGSTVDAWRLFGNGGTYPTNKVRLPHPANKLDFALARRITIDYRNKLLFYSIESGGFVSIYRRNIDLSGPDIFIFQKATVSGVGADLRCLCVDYLNGYIFYVICSDARLQPSPGAGLNNEYDYQIRRVDYDGTGDTLVYTETVVTASLSNVAQIMQLTWEPTSGYLFYTIHRSVEVTIDNGFGTMVTGAPIFAYIHRMDTGGGGNTIIVSYELTSIYASNYGIKGFSVNAQAQRILWILQEVDSGPGAGPFPTVTSIRSAYYDGSGLTVHLSSIVDNLDWVPLNLVYCSKDQRAYFNSPVAGNEALRSFDLVFNAVRTELDQNQVDLQTGESSIINPMMSVSKEFTGTSYTGGSQSSD